MAFLTTITFAQYSGLHIKSQYRETINPTKMGNIRKLTISGIPHFFMSNSHWFHRQDGHLICGTYVKTSKQ